MAQFEVYENPNSRTRKQYPYIVDIQSPVISDIDTRIVIPVGKAHLFANEFMDKLTSLIEFGDDKFILLIPQIASVPSKILKIPTGTIAHLRDEIINALDFSISGF